jgi:hypothetical protein
VADIRQINLDDIAKTITVAGTPGQMSMADWVIHTLDAPNPASQPQQFAAPGTAGDVIRVYFTHAATPQSLQEIVTTIRSVADVQRMFIYNRLRAAVLRDNVARIGLADWLMQKLDQPGQTAAPQEYTVAGPRGPEVARVFYLVHPQGPRDMQEIATTLRSIADIPRIFMYIAPKALAVRAPADRVALAQWLVTELDRPANEPAASGAHRYELPTGTDNQVRVFYLNPSTSADQRQRIIADVRSAAYVQRLFVYNSLSALTVRGTVGQIATAERLLDELHQSGQ